jgi:hypothetical protein
MKLTIDALKNLIYSNDQVILGYRVDIDNSIDLNRTKVYKNRINGLKAENKSHRSAIKVLKETEKIWKKYT